MILVAIYRPGSKAITRRFFSELTELLEHLATHRCPVVLTGDFSVRVHRPEDKHALSLTELLASFDMVQHVTVPTHNFGGMLDLVIARSVDRIDTVSVDWNGISLHAQLLVTVALTLPGELSLTTTLRSWKNFNQELFNNDLMQSALCHPFGELDGQSLDNVFDQYDSVLTQIINKHATFKMRKMRTRLLTPLFDSDCRAAKRRSRRLKRRYYKSKLGADCARWLAELKVTNKLYQSKSNGYWTSKISENATNPKKLWNSLNTVLGRKNNSHAASSGHSSGDFQMFFMNKTDEVARSTVSAALSIITKSVSTSFSFFEEFTVCEIDRLVIAAPNKQCALDPVPMRIVKASCLILAPFLTYICNRSLPEGYLPPSQKAALVFPLIKNPNND